MTGTTSSTDAAGDSSVIIVTASNQLIDPGDGDHTIRFSSGTGADTVVPHAGGMLQIVGFDPGTDFLDIRSLLSAFNLDPNGNPASLSRYLTVTDQGSNALLRFDPFGQGDGRTVAVLRDLAETVTNLSGLLAQNAIRYA